VSAADRLEAASQGEAGAASGGPAKSRPAKSARRRARELAVQGLYQWLLSPGEAGVIESDISAAAIGFARADQAHFQALLHGSIREIEALHAAIAPFIDRTLQELSPVEHATLLVGSYELMHHAEIPYRVVINEAVEIAKTFGGTDGYKYVNGVLDRVAGQLRPPEAPARR
jgi:transcription antitermination protein NusB